MGLKLVYEALEIERLLDEEKAARNKGPIAEQTLEDEQVDEVVEKKKEEGVNEEDPSMDTSSEDPGDAGEEDPDAAVTEADESSSESGEAEPVKGEGEEEDKGGEDEDTTDEKTSDEKEDKPVQESLREIGQDDLAMESFGEVVSTVGRAVAPLASTAIGSVYRGLQWAVVTVAGLAAKHGPGILSAMYKGVIYALAKTFDVLGKTYTLVDKAIERRRNSIDSLKEQLSVLKNTISSIESKETPTEDMVISYGNRAVIDSLKSGESVDFVKNLQVLDKFLTVTIANLHKSILDDIAGIQYLTTAYTHAKKIDHVDLLRLKSSGVGLSTGTVVGYEPSSEVVVAYKSTYPLPGDAVVIAEFPSTDLKTQDAYEAAYKDSKLYLGFNKVNYHQVNDVKLVGFSHVKNMVVVLEKLIATCEKQQTLYEDIRKTKPGVMLSIKKHAMHLVESNTKVRYSDSLVGPMHLKSTFIAKVYLAGSLDIHDYAAKTISNGLSLAEELAKKYS